MSHETFYPFVNISERGGVLEGERERGGCGGGRRRKKEEEEVEQEEEE